MPVLSPISSLRSFTQALINSELRSDIPSLGCTRALQHELPCPAVPGGVRHCVALTPFIGALQVLLVFL